jgi:hypothetical protein
VDQLCPVDIGGRGDGLGVGEGCGREEREQVNGGRGGDKVDWEAGRCTVCPRLFDVARGGGRGRRSGRCSSRFFLCVFLSVPLHTVADAASHRSVFIIPFTLTATSFTPSQSQQASPVPPSLSATSSWHSPFLLE